MTEQRYIPVQHLKVTDDFEGQRIDNYLFRELRSVPKTRVYKLLRSGQVRVNKGRVKASYKLLAGDTIRVPPIHLLPEVEKAAVKPELLSYISSRILFEDEQIVVVNKPSGLPVHGGSGLSFGLIEIMKVLFPQDKHIELVHRLDKGTSGCLVFAKKRSVLKELHAAFREDSVKKEYWALTKGLWSKAERRVNAPLKRYQTASGERIVRVNQREGKLATTWFESLRKFEHAELVLARPVTGRTHQIRVHAQSVGHEIAGDDKYGEREFNQIMRKNGLSRLFLHAKSIELPTGTGSSKRIEAPLDDDLQALLDRMQ